jgi:hypothetical protein
MIVKPIRDQAWGSAYLLFALNAESKVVLVRRIRNGVGAGRRLLLIGDIHSDSQKLPGPEGLKGFAVFRFQIEGGDSFTFGHSPIQNELAPSDPGRAFFGPQANQKKLTRLSTCQSALPPSSRPTGKVSVLYPSFLYWLCPGDKRALKQRGKRDGGSRAM